MNQKFLSHLRLLGGPLRYEDLIVSRNCGGYGDSANLEEIELSDSGTATMSGCFNQSGSLIESESLNIRLYNEDTYYYQAGYDLDHNYSFDSGTNCGYQYNVKRGYNGAVAQDAQCTYTLTYEGGDNYDPHPEDDCDVTSTTDASVGLYGFNDVTGEGCLLNPIGVTIGRVLCCRW